MKEMLRDVCLAVMTLSLLVVACVAVNQNATGGKTACCQPACCAPCKCKDCKCCPACKECCP